MVRLHLHHHHHHCTIISILLFFLSLSSAFNFNSLGNETDALALFAIKSKISHDPLGITTSWNQSLHFCKWVGVKCGHLHQRVTILNLTSLGLVGSLSPFIGNLTFLSAINLELNYFHGEIPPQIGNLFRLKHLNLSNNSFSGEIPANLSGCSGLVGLPLGFNDLTGNLPFQLGSLKNLEKMKLHYNNLSGSIPDSFGNLSSINAISIAVNNLEGRIPDAIGKLKILNFLGIGLNRFSGIIPPSIFNLSSLASFTVPYNQLHGTLPWDLGFTLPNLQIFNFGHNLFTGPLPVSLSNASNLIEFDIIGSTFSGKVSVDFGGSNNLFWLVLASNFLGEWGHDDLSFLNSLTRCSNLQVLDLSDNQFSGMWPNAISNLSTNLLTLRLGRNMIHGSISNGIENLVNLTELQLQKNNLTGEIPITIGNLKMLRLLDLSENGLSGFIPSSLTNISQLYSLHLENNHLIGNIPPSFEHLQYLQQLDISQNHLNGTIPNAIMGLSSLTTVLNLAQNYLSGPLPSEFGALINLGYLDVSENLLSGKIPNSIGSCVTLERLHMEGNFFQGSIPSSFSSLRGLQDFDISRNNLSGQIPNYFQHISFQNLNLSFNQFEGEVPTGGVFGNLTAISINGNPLLCGGTQELKLPKCPKKKRETSRSLKLMIPLLSSLLLLVLIMSVFVIYRLRKTKREASIESSSRKGTMLKVSYEMLVEATGAFSSENLIGSGSFGSVYRGIFHSDETVVAVKVLHLQERGALKSFVAECETLRNIRHRNLVKILTVCSSIDFQNNEFKALVYEFMENGNLDRWLHPIGNSEEERISLNLIQRVNIAIDVASALDYLHNHCHKPIVHCDLKPSNVLLDNEMTAHVSDFGLARFVQENGSRANQSSTSFGLKGTIGYAAPEYGTGSKVSFYGDMYSYGILLLEMFTGKRPTDGIFIDGLNLHNFVEMGLPERITEILDPIILSSEEDDENMMNELESSSSSMLKSKVDQIQECLISILRIGVACSAESPRERMEIGDVIRELRLIKDILRASRNNYSSISGSTRYEGSSSRSATNNWQNVI